MWLAFLTPSGRTTQGTQEALHLPQMVNYRKMHHQLFLCPCPHKTDVPSMTPSDNQHPSQALPVALGQVIPIEPPASLHIQCQSQPQSQQFFIPSTKPTESFANHNNHSHLHEYEEVVNHCCKLCWQWIVCRKAAFEPVKTNPVAVCRSCWHSFEAAANPS